MPLDFASKFRGWVARCKAFLGIEKKHILIRLVPTIANNPRALGATIDSDETYDTAHILIKDPRLGGHDDWPLTVLHELVHVSNGGTCGTRPGSEARANLERSTERMTRSIYALLCPGAAARDEDARICLRLDKTAREGGGKGMDEQLLKELLALAEDPDYQAASEGLKAKIAKLIMMAKGGEAVPPSAPEGAALAVDPMAEPKDKKDDFAMRRAAIDASLKRAAADAAAIEKGAFMARLGHELQLTPEQEKKLAGMPVEHARIYADALKEAGAIKPNLQSVSLRSSGKSL